MLIKEHRGIENAPFYEYFVLIRRTHLGFRHKVESLIKIWTKFLDIVTKRQIEKTTVYPLFSLFIPFSAIEIRWVFLTQSLSG